VSAICGAGQFQFFAVFGFTTGPLDAKHDKHGAHASARFIHLALKFSSPPHVELIHRLVFTAMSAKPLVFNIWGSGIPHFFSTSIAPQQVAEHTT
jgi:hypothetical protein